MPMGMMGGFGGGGFGGGNTLAPRSQIPPRAYVAMLVAAQLLQPPWQAPPPIGPTA